MRNFWFHALISGIIAFGIFHFAELPSISSATTSLAELIIPADHYTGEYRIETPPPTSVTPSHPNYDDQLMIIVITFIEGLLVLITTFISAFLVSIAKAWSERLFVKKNSS